MRAWFLIGAITGWLVSVIVAGIPEVPAECGALRWARVAAEHPVRTSIAFGALLTAACGTWRPSPRAPPGSGR
ncbi:MAG: hypothetical protein ACKVWV_06515 [Planctomycetota bacterium]